MREPAKLPPCPRCGGSGELVKLFPSKRYDCLIRCTACGAETKCYVSPQNARKAWCDGCFDGGKDE